MNVSPLIPCMSDKDISEVLVRDVHSFVSSWLSIPLLQLDVSQRYDAAFSFVACQIPDIEMLKAVNSSAKQ